MSITQFIYATFATSRTHNGEFNATYRTLIAYIENEIGGTV